MLFDLIDLKSGPAAVDPQAPSLTNRVRLNFLDNLPYRKYLNRRNNAKQRGKSINEISLSGKLASSVKITAQSIVSSNAEKEEEDEDEYVETNANNERQLALAFYDNRQREATNVDSVAAAAESSRRNNSASYNYCPPLTLNALMEYKQVIEAPGRGDFEHGRPRVFKI